MVSTLSTSVALKMSSGNWPGMHNDSDRTISNRVTHWSRRDIFSPAYTAQIFFSCPGPNTPQEVYETRSRDAFIVKGKVVHVTAPPISLYPRIPRLLEKGYLGWYSLSPENHLNDFSPSFCDGYLRPASTPQANSQEQALVRVRRQDDRR